MSVNGLNKITERILGDARAEAERILSEAREDCARIAADYASRADGVREKLTAQAEEKAEDMIARAKAAAAMQERNLLLQQRSDLIDGVFAGAQEWVLSLDGEKYTELLAGLLSAALMELVNTEAHNRAVYGDEEEPVQADYEVCLGKKDRSRCGEAVVAAVRKKLAGKLPEDVLSRLVLSEETLAADGGAVLRWGDISCNCTFGLLFSQLRRELEGEVGRALFESRGQRI